MKSLLRNEWQLLLFGLLMTFWSSPGQTFLLALFGGAIREDLGLSHAGFGGIYSLATLGSALLVIWTGSLIDRLPLRQFTVGILLGLGLASWLLSSSQHLVSLALAFLLLRQFGQSLMMLCASTTLVRYIEADRGKAVAIGGMGYHLSEAILPSLVIALLVTLSWREVLGLQSLVIVLIVIPMALLLLRGHDARHRAYLERERQSALDNPDKRELPTAMRSWTRADVLRDPRFYLIAPAILTVSIFFTGFIFHQIHLTETKGWSLAVWGSLFLLYAAVTIVSKLVTGVLIDRLGAVRLLPFSPVPLGLGALLLASGDHIAVAAGFLGLMAISTGISSTISGPLWAELYGTRHIGAIKSLSSAAVAFGSALSPFAMGWLIDRGTSIETLALGTTAYVVIAVALARYALRSVSSGH